MNEMKGDPKPNFLWYTLRLQSFLETNDITQHGLEQICSHMEKTYNLKSTAPQ